MFHCDKCDADCIEAYAHRCDKWNVACMGKHVCIDCNLRHFSSLKEVQASSLREVRSIPEGGYCKHLTPEYWAKKGYMRTPVMRAMGNPLTRLKREWTRRRLQKRIGMLL